MRDPVVTIAKALSVQVCVPADWTDEQVKEFAENEYPCGTANGWRPRADRVSCGDGGGMVHVLLMA